jgi:hypothetical protein
LIEHTSAVDPSCAVCVAGETNEVTIVANELKQDSELTKVDTIDTHHDAHNLCDYIGCGGCTDRSSVLFCRGNGKPENVGRVAILEISGVIFETTHTTVVTLRLIKEPWIDRW